MLLVNQQQLSLQDIADPSAVLVMCLKDILGPRWAFLLLRASSVGILRPVGHLTALSPLSDDEFALKSRYGSPGATCTVASVLDGQQTNMRVCQLNGSDDNYFP